MLDAYLEPSRTSTVKLLSGNYKKNFTVDIRMGSKYASGTNFAVEKICRMSIFVLYSQHQLCQSQWKNCHWLLVSWINKKLVGLTRINKKLVAAANMQIKTQ